MLARNTIKNTCQNYENHKKCIYIPQYLGTIKLIKLNEKSF